MSELPPSFTQGGCTTAQADRQINSSLVCSQGIAPGVGGELQVTERAAGANMSVDVASGNAFIEGTESGWQGMYHVSADATENLVVAASDPTDARIDIVVATVRDSAYSGANDDWILQVITGTPSPAPVAPTVPDNSLLLATINIPAGSTTVDSGDITDERVNYGLCAASGGLLETLVFTSSDTFLKVNYPLMAYLDVEVQGAGGGGGGCSAFDDSYGAGGGSGGYARGIIPVASLGASETITVGAGGAGGTGSSGSNGASSSFGSHIACAGGQGGGSDNGATFASGGNSGNVPTAPGDAVEIEGQDGDNGWSVSTLVHSGAGADSSLGLGGMGFDRHHAQLGSLTGRDGTGYGSGGGGALNTQVGLNTGGDGASGVVIVRVYA